MTNEKAAAPEDPLARALGYPYAAHETDFLFRNGQALPLPEDYAFDGLTPVVAVGSNRSPAQLVRKFAGMAAAVPVTRLRAHDVDVVYAAQVASYGSVPATLAASPGTTAELWITWLDRPALAHMDGTEGVGVSYDRVTVKLPWVGPGPHAPDRALLYTARRGTLRLDGAPVAVAAVPAEDRRFPAMSQEQLLRRLHAAYGAGGFEAWLAGLIGPAGQAGRRTLAESLASAADLSPCPGIVTVPGADTSLGT